MNSRRLYLSFILLGAVVATAQQVAVPRRQSPRHVRIEFNATPRDWSQFNYDSGHSGTNADEESLAVENVAGLRMFFQVHLPGVADGAPVLWANDSNRRSNHYLFFTTTDGALVATSGDGMVRWQTPAPAGPRWTTSSPALDPNRQFVYSYGLDGRVHKYWIRSGVEFVEGGWPVLVTKKPDVEKASSALSIVTARDDKQYLYIALAGYPDPGDAGDYQGHVVAIRLSDAHTTIFNALCSNKHTILGYRDCASVQAGIWGRPGVVYNEGDDSIYVVTSNGSFNANQGGSNWADSVLRLRPNLHTRGTGKPLDSYTPAEYETLDARDLDLGSSALALLARPGEDVATLGVHAGKDSVVRLIDLKNMSGAGEPGHVGGELQSLKLPQGGFNSAAPAVWIDDDGRTWVYFANNRGVSALELVGDAKSPQLVERWRTTQAGNSSPVVVNGILFTARSGRISALNAHTGEELWFDTRVGPIHWQSPIVVNGAVYITDLDGNLTCYALPREFMFLR